IRCPERKRWPKQPASTHATILFMSIVSARPAGWMLFAGALFWILCGDTAAHPVAQGGLIVTIFPNRLIVRATVSLEEVLVASAYGPESARVKSPAEAAERHGLYLLEHLRLNGDGRRLPGRLIHSASAGAGEKTNRFVYEFAYALDKPASEFRFDEDVLNEFEFAPGNRWEASYIVQINEEGYALREGLLLTSRQPLVFVRENPSMPSSARPRLDRRQVLRDY